MWRFIRISLLLMVLVGVAGVTYLDKKRTTSWQDTLWVGIFPMNADGSSVADSYIRTLSVKDFAPVESFFARETRRYGINLLRPVRIELYPSPKELPPALSAHANVFQRILWSLKMRWFARSAADVPGRAPSHIRVFVLYHDPAVSPNVPHSLGLQKGLVGVVHAFAEPSMTGENNIVITHETLHTLGASDKYDLHTGAPIFPDGYAEPKQNPLYPQAKAEIMAGQRVISDSESEMPQGLGDVVVGPKTATEIGWGKQ